MDWQTAQAEFTEPKWARAAVDALIAMGVPKADIRVSHSPDGIQNLRNGETWGSLIGELVGTLAQSNPDAVALTGGIVGAVADYSFGGQDTNDADQFPISVVVRTLAINQSSLKAALQHYRGTLVDPISLTVPASPRSG